RIVDVTAEYNEARTSFVICHRASRAIPRPAFAADSARRRKLRPRVPRPFPHIVLAKVRVLKASKKYNALACAVVRRGDAVAGLERQRERLRCQQRPGLAVIFPRVTQSR